MKLDPNNIKIHFNAIARDYDGQRRKLIPCFDDFYGCALHLTEMIDNPLNVLDLGAGTGLFSEMILSRHPGINLTLIDLSDEMMNIARQRFQGVPNITFVIGDYLNDVIEGQYDMIVSSLSIHHLTANEKQELFLKVYDLLKPGGIFINADQVLGPEARMDALYKMHWRETIKRSGLSYEELEQADQRTRLDKMSTMSEHMKWLKNVGFSPVDVVYKSYSFIVLYGQKPE